MTSSQPLWMKIEIPFGSNVKYEFQNGRLVCDRVLHTPMQYPFNYGYLENTLADDGDHLDAVLLTDIQFVPGCHIQVKIIGALITEDEKGMDEKVLVVPISKVYPSSAEINDISNLRPEQKEQIKFFFEYYKQLEKGKWIKVGDYVDCDKAIQIYQESVNKFNSSISE